MFTKTVLAAVSLTAIAALALPVGPATAGASPADSGRESPSPHLRPVGAPPSAVDVGSATLLSRGSRIASIPKTHASKRARALGAVRCDDGSVALCGSFTVPLDRRHDDGRTASIDFKLFVHTKAGSPKSTIWWNGGGPGPSTTRVEPWLPDYLFGGLMGHFDVLLTDVRGTGSTAPACPELQTFEGYWPDEVSTAAAALDACSSSIADRIDTYGSGDTARDLNALRKALDIEELDIVGNSYGAMPATAYAVRFPKHTRSVIISSGVNVGETIHSKLDHNARSINRMVNVLCERSPACSSGVPNARAALAAGVRQVRAHPPAGMSISANNPTEAQYVRLTEPLLFGLLVEADNTFLGSTGEVAAAMVALARGDKAPALRLAADAKDMLTVPPNEVPASEDSAGGYFAIECSDYTLPWAAGLTPEERLKAASAAVVDLDGSGGVGAWHPSSIVDGSVYANWQQLINCNHWPDVNASRIVPKNASYPKVPALVMTSTFDPRTPVEDARSNAKRWPNSQLLNIGGALHGAALWSCGPERVRAFIKKPGTHQQPCDPADFPAYRAVGEFPVTSADARPLAVRKGGGNEATRHDRRLAAVALETALDANSVNTRQFFVGEGAGLRGGGYEASEDDSGYRISLQDNKFASDVTVNGEMFYPYDGSTPTIDVTFMADDGTTGHLKVTAYWNAGRSAADPSVVRVRGHIEGRKVALLFPL